MVKRYITVPAIKIGNDLIPIWDKDVTYEKDEDYGEFLNVNRHRCHDFVECVYDLKKRVLLPGIVLDIYPNDEKSEYKKEMSCFYEKSHHKLEEVTIVDIVYETYDSTIIKGKKMDKWYKNFLTSVTINPDDIYCVRSWKPTYVLSNGVKTEYTHELYQKAK